MALAPPPMLASIDAMRPVFLIVMGLSISVIAWRLTRRTKGWPSRFLMAGALLLTLGYSLIIPLYEAKVLLPLNLVMFVPDADHASVLAWHLTKIFSMNGGWLLFGIGLALYARSKTIQASTSSPATVQILP